VVERAPHPLPVVERAPHPLPVVERAPHPLLISRACSASSPVGRACSASSPVGRACSASSPYQSSVLRILSLSVEPAYASSPSLLLVRTRVQLPSQWIELRCLFLLLASQSCNPISRRSILALLWCVSYSWLSYGG
jgi:hypothetical protein